MPPSPALIMTNENNYTFCLFQSRPWPGIACAQENPAGRAVRDQPCGVGLSECTPADFKRNSGKPSQFQIPKESRHVPAYAV
jgi:hypothetical protein